MVRFLHPLLLLLLFGDAIAGFSFNPPQGELRVIAFAPAARGAQVGSGSALQYEQRAKQFMQSIRPTPKADDSLLTGVHATRDALRRALQKQTSHDTLVIYLTGDTFVAGDIWALTTTGTTRDSDKRQDPATGVTGSDLVRWISDSSIKQVLLLMDADTGPGLCPLANLSAGSTPYSSIHLICARRPGDARRSAPLINRLGSALEGAADEDGNGDIRLFELISHLGKQGKIPPLFVQLAGTDLILKNLNKEGPTARQKLDRSLLQLASTNHQAKTAAPATQQGSVQREGLIPVVVTSSHDSGVVWLVDRIRALGGRFHNLVGAKIYAGLPQKALVPLASSHRVWNMTYNSQVERPVAAEKESVSK